MGACSCEDLDSRTKGLHFWTVVESLFRISKDLNLSQYAKCHVLETCNVSHCSVAELYHDVFQLVFVAAVFESADHTAGPITKAEGHRTNVVQLICCHHYWCPNSQMQHRSHVAERLALQQIPEPFRGLKYLQLEMENFPSWCNFDVGKDEDECSNFWMSVRFPMLLAIWCSPE